MQEAESLHVAQLEGVEMIIAIDSTARGPSLGGCRWKRYPDSDAARRDALALAAAMTRKSALARLPLGAVELRHLLHGDIREIKLMGNLSIYQVYSPTLKRVFS